MTQLTNVVLKMTGKESAGVVEEALDTPSLEVKAIYDDVKDHVRNRLLS